MLQNQHFIETPFYKNQNTTKKLNRILVNAVGFGGNAVSILIEL
jgi:3-oxoacyl-(acyl-carrier-protein) synthase